MQDSKTRLLSVSLNDLPSEIWTRVQEHHRGFTVGGFVLTVSILAMGFLKGDANEPPREESVELSQEYGIDGKAMPNNFSARTVTLLPIVQEAGMGALDTAGGNVSAAATRGEIQFPTPGTTVPPEFLSNGTIDLDPGDVGWLAVHKGNLYWPKEPAIHQSGTWQVKVFEGGPKGYFDLVLITVSPDEALQIMSWFESGHATGRYPGRLMTGYKLLDETRLKLN